MATRRVELMREDASAHVAAAYVVPDLVVAVQEAVYNAIDAHASRVAVVVDAAQATFSVTDDGDGIDPDEMYEHLFECNASSKADRSLKKYGYRGQYLVALGTLAKQVELESRMEAHWTSFRKVVENACVVFNARSKTTKTTKGTVLRVQNIFWLLPVRQRELEAHASTRMRVAKRLSSFFHSISMIWPTLSLDVSFPDTKVPRSIIPGVSSCEERLRGVFGGVLGSDLEYITFDVDDLPFTIRGYAAVIRDAGDGDAYLESPGWRQARAYYQYVFLDNLWLEDFQRECCKTINTAAIALELGIPIFVLKISVKSHEYDLHSDGHTRAVNLKRPEMLTQTIRRFGQMLKARVAEADARLAAMALNEMALGAPESEMLSEHELSGDHEGDIKAEAYAEQLPAQFYQDPFDHGDIEAYSQKMAEVYELDRGETWTEATCTETEALDREVEEEEKQLWDYGDRGFYSGGSDVQYDYYVPHAHQTVPIEHCVHSVHEGVSTPFTKVEDPAVVSEQVYANQGSTGYYGCSKCGSCGHHGSTPKYANEHPPLAYYQTAAGVTYVLGPPQYGYEGRPQSFTYSYGTRASNYGIVAPTNVASHTNLHHIERPYLDYLEQAAAYHSTVSDNIGSFVEVEVKEEEIPHQGMPIPTTTVLTTQQQEYDELFFGHSLPRERPRPLVSRRLLLQDDDEDEEETKEAEADEWVSSRRIGVPQAEQPREEVPIASQHERRERSDNSASTETTIVASEPGEKDVKYGNSERSGTSVSPDPTIANSGQEGESGDDSGSHQLSEYFSLEKLAKANPRSLGKAISKFASKRTALAGLAGSFGLEHSPMSVRVAPIPSDLHSSTAKAMTIDKNLLQHLQVIKQVDRKFILVRAKLDSSASGDTAKTLLMCIDQHAADERVRLEQFERQVFGVHGNERNVELANHTPSLVLSLNARERETLNLFLDEIRSWGFGAEPTESGPVVLTHTPRIDTRVAGVDDFREYLQLLSRSDAVVARRVLRPPVVTRFLHSRACRSAIMFGDYLSFSQCEDIVEQLGRCSLPFQCAHGRPSIVPLIELA